MSVHWDRSKKRWRFEFARKVGPLKERVRVTRLLPTDWDQAQADAFDRAECARLYAEHSGVAPEKPKESPLIQDAINFYLADKTHLKSFRKTAEHLAAIAWAYTGKRFEDLPAIAVEVVEAGLEDDFKPATIRQRLAWLKAACRWGWKTHEMGDHNPAEKMVLPKVSNARHVYPTREEMLRIARACRHHGTRVAIRAGFYTGWRLGEFYTLHIDKRHKLLVLPDSKNGDRRALPYPDKLRTIIRLGLLPLSINRSTLQKDRREARAAVGLEHITFHDLRHGAASEMINAGVDLHTVGEVLGHKDPRSTKRYAHLTAHTLGNAVNLIGKKRSSST